MPSSASTSLRFEKQATGENLNTWGARLNTVIDLVEQAIAGRTNFALSGSKTLTATNYASDEARSMMLDVTSGTGGTITIPAVSKVYLVRNGSSGDVTVTTGGSTNAVLKAGEVRFVMCDGTDVRLAAQTDFGGAKLTNIGTPTSDTDACTKAYADGLSFAAASGALPGQAGNAGKFLTTDGTTASWGTAMAGANNLSELTNSSTARGNLGLGTAATKSTGTSGGNVPLMNTANTWSALQTFSSGISTTSASFSSTINVTGAATLSGAVTCGSTMSVNGAVTFNDTLTVGGAMSAASLTLTTKLAVAQGGTGSGTAAGARSNLLPSYTGNAAKVLAVNSGGTDVEWVAQSAGTEATASFTGSTTPSLITGSSGFGSISRVTTGTYLLTLDTMTITTGATVVATINATDGKTTIYAGRQTSTTVSVKTYVDGVLTDTSNPIYVRVKA